MTSFAPDQATGPNLTAPVTIVLDSPARHRPDHARAYGPPAWLPLALTLIAAASAWFSIDVYVTFHDPAAILLMGLAALYAVIAFAVDVWAAVTARRNQASE